jgi:glycosyltransferase involved in cell wall biosynthesis
MKNENNIPRVSLIIPTYNRAHLLPDAVNSALGQSYRNFEVIIIDDGSTDNTRKIALSFPPQVRYVYQENQGAPSAFNKGIKLARGEYLAIFADDDMILESFLEKTVKFMDEHPEIGFCHGQVYTIDENGRPLRLNRARGKMKSFIIDGKEEISELLIRNYIVGCSVLFRRSCFDKVGLFNPNLRSCEDWDMWIRLAKEYAIGYLAEPLAKYRVHTQSLTGHFVAESVKKDYIDLLNSVFKDVDFGPRYAHLQRKAYFSMYCYLAKISAERGHRTTGIKYIFQSFLTCPSMFIKPDGISILIDTAKGFVTSMQKKIIMRILRAFKLW